jgi:DNA polymerase III subunit epsilon
VTAFLAFDIESTGTDPATARIVELCVVEIRDLQDPGTEAVWRFNPGIPIPPEATAVHGIMDADVAGAPPFVRQAGRIQRLVQGRTLIAFNGIRYDVPLLHYELQRAGQPGIPVSAPVIDPYRLYLEDCPRTLASALRFYLDRDGEGLHGARADTHALLDVLRAQADRRGLSNLAGLMCAPEKQWLDHGHCFYRDADGVVRFGFGKHRDVPATSEPGFLRWMLSRDFSSDVRATAAKLLATHEA